MVQVGVSTLVLTALTVSTRGQPVEVPCRAVLTGHRGPVGDLSLSADGHMLVTTGREDGTVRIWDLASGTEQRRFKQEIGDRMIKIWDLAPGTEQRLIKEEIVDVTIPTLRMRLASPEKQLELLREQPHTKRTKPLHIRAFLLSDNRRIVLGISDQNYSEGVFESVCQDEIVVYDLERGKCDTLITTGRKCFPETGNLGMGEIFDHSSKFTFNFDGHIRVSTNFKNINELTHYFNSSLMNRIDIYDIPRRRYVIAELHDARFDFYSPSFSPDGRTVSTFARPKAPAPVKKQLLGTGIALWNARTWEKIARVHADGRQIWGSRFSPNGREMLIICGTYANTVCICSLETYKISRTLNDFGEKPSLSRIAIRSLDYTRDGKFLVAGAANGTVLFWETENYRQVLWARLAQSGGVHLSSMPDNKRMMAIPDNYGKSTDRSIKFWDVDQFLSLMPKGRGKTK